MKYGKAIWILLTLSVCLALLAGCGGSPATAEVDKAETPAPSAPAVSENPVEETDPSILPDGEYIVDVDTDSSMFHLNEASEGKGVLTVRNGEMTVHISLPSKNIVHLYPGLAADAAKEGAVLLEPTLDSVTYSDGVNEEVYGFDIPVPYLDEDFDCAILGAKGNWYDHRMSVSAPDPSN